MKRFLNVLKALTGFMLVVFSLFVMTGVYIILYSYGDTEKHADCAVVFGSAINRDGTPSQVLSDRIKTAYELYKSGSVDCIIVTGADSIYGKHESDVMKDMLIFLSVPRQIIYTDYKGKNTCASLKNLDKQKKYIFVSNDFHLARINFLAKKMGLKEYLLYPSRHYDGVYIKTPYFFSREIVAFWYYMLFFDSECKRDFRNINAKVDTYVTRFFKYIYGNY